MAIFTPLQQPIRNGQLPDWTDLNRTRDVFRGLGLYDDNQDGPMLDKSLVKAIENFQRSRDLIVDGIMNPGGETEQELIKETGGRLQPKQVKIVSTDDKIGFGGVMRGVSSSKDPHHPDFGLIQKPKKKSINTPLRVQSEEKANRDLFKLSDQWIENWSKERKKLDENEKSHRDYISRGRLIGLNSAADNLEHYLDGQGKDKILTRKDVEKRPFLKEAAEENNKRFQTQTFKHGSEHAKKLLNLKDGEEAEVNDYWVKKISDNDHFKSLRFDEFFATGNSHVQSDAILKAKRKGNQITVEGTINHNWNDLYDFDKEKFSDAYELQEKGRAKNYKINANWKQKIKMNFETKNGKLIYSNKTVEDVKE